jgi:hypothetical protein
MNKSKKFLIVLAVILFTATSYNFDNIKARISVKTQKDTFDLTTSHILSIGKSSSDSISFSFYVPNSDVTYVDFMVQNNSKDYDLFIETNSKKDILPFQPGHALGAPLSIYGTTNNLLFIQNEYVNGLIHNKYSKTTSFHAVDTIGENLVLQYNLKEFYYNNSIVKLKNMRGKTLYCLVSVTVKNGYTYKDMGTTPFKIVFD